MQTTSKGRQFIKMHEGNPLTAYLDPASPPVPTIGPGLTNRSATVTRMIGKIVPGKTQISAALADRVFAAVLAEEVDPIVTRGMPGAQPHEFDAGSSGSYNLGATRFMGWTWADLWRAGRKQAAAEHLATHYMTAGGRILPGLKTRREAEARLLLEGVYTGIDFAGQLPPKAAREAQPVAPGTPDLTVKEAQEILIKKGFDVGDAGADGWLGEKTKAAIEAYQSQHPHLKVDGILGAATIAQLQRDAKAIGQVVKDTITKAAPAATGAGTLAFLADLPWFWIGGVVLVGGVAVFAWRYRDIWARRANGAS